MCRHLIAVCVEGSDKIFLFNTKMEGKLSASGSIEIPGIELPNHLAFDDSGNLWAASGCQGKIPFRIEALSAESFDGKTIISEDSSPDISQNLVCDNKLRIALGDESSRESKFTSKEALRYVPGVQVPFLFLETYLPSNHLNTNYQLVSSSQFTSYPLCKLLQRIVSWTAKFSKLWCHSILENIKAHSKRVLSKLQGPLRKALIVSGKNCLRILKKPSSRQEILKQRRTASFCMRKFGYVSRNLVFRLSLVSLFTDIFFDFHNILL